MKGIPCFYFENRRRSNYQKSTWKAEKNSTFLGTMNEKKIQICLAAHVASFDAIWGFLFLSILKVICDDKMGENLYKDNAFSWK